MENITEQPAIFKVFERNIFETMCRAACEETQRWLLLVDKHIMETRDTREYRLIDSRTTTIKALYGEVTFERRYYRDRSGKYVFLLDEALGIDCGCGLISENLAEAIVSECLDKAFRKVSYSITNATGQCISAMGAWGVFKQYGSKVDEQVTRLKELEGCGETGQLGNVSSRVLFQEYDDIWISVQKEKRQKRGEADTNTAGKAGGGSKKKKKKKKKRTKKPMHVGISYTGIRESKDGRRSADNKIAYASFGEPAEFASTFETLQNHCYDMDGVERRIANGDGEGWIRTEAELREIFLQLDPFHRSQSIIKAVRDEKYRQLLFDAIKDKDVDKTLSIARSLADNAQDEKERDKLSKFYGYLHNNSDILLTWQERGVELPPPPEGVTYGNLGIQESSNCNLITLRMKNRKASWSINGANNMARLLSLRGTIGIDTFLCTLPEPDTAGPWLEPLSAAQAPRHDGKGYGADWLYAPMPFEHVARTHGRETIRDMLGCKPISQLAFR